jgi:hypothetical protein
MTQVDLEGDVGFSTSTFPVEVCRGSIPPLLQELKYGPGCCCWEVLFHGVVLWWWSLYCHLTYHVCC